MKKQFMACAAVLAIVAAATPTLAEDDQAPSEPAGMRYNPEPTMQEEIVYLRDIVALQTLRLDEAEEMIVRQTALLEAQAARLVALEESIGGEGRQRLAGAPVQPDASSVHSDEIGGVYIVESGDTLSRIADRYSTTIASLAADNNLTPPYRLQVGQRLAVTGAASGLTAQASASEAGDTEGSVQRLAAAQPAPAAGERPDVTERAIAEQRRDDAPQETSAPEEVGIRPEDEGERPYLSIFTDVGGILTPRGTLYAEPAVDFTVTSDNRFFFQGIEIIDAILIGAIEATDSDRRALTESIALRYGLTNRLEIDGRFSYLSREDRISGVAIDDGSTTVRELDGSGVGDAEVGVHYQLNSGRGFPYTVLNLRAKAPTGRGPFDVDREVESGIETELATGSGYWSIEPSLTFILPSDPAVFFANVGYQANLATSPDAIVGATTIREFNPGDAIRTSFGVGLSLNDRASINFGYDQSHFLRTSTLIETLGPEGEILLTDARQPAATVGSFLFGGSYAVSDRLRLNLNTAFGATDEAPDMRISLRAQVRLFD